MPEISKKVSVSTFQQCDGSNFTTAGVEAGIKAGRGNLSLYTGIGTNFCENSTGSVIDFKGGVPYGNGLVSGGFRVRNNLNPNSQTVQIRVQPATVNVPVSSSTSIYATPYVSTKIDYKDGYKSTDAGVFAGVSQKIGKASIFVEGQIYDVTKVNSSTTSINAGISIPF